MLAIYWFHSLSACGNSGDKWDNYPQSRIIALVLQEIALVFHSFFPSFPQKSGSFPQAK
jgi:hypothetical protein